MSTRYQSIRWLSVIATLSLLVGACSGSSSTPSPQGTSVPSPQGTSVAAASPSAVAVQTGGFESLGNVTLNVASLESGGDADALQQLTNQFMQKYPNVHINITQKDFTSWMASVKLAASSSSAPDLFEGNQGYQVDGALAKAGLILPLDKYAAAYGWDSEFAPATLSQNEYTSSGQYGTGQLYGLSMYAQIVGVYANLTKLGAAGIDLSSIKTFADFEQMLATLKQKLPATDPVILTGASDLIEFDQTVYDIQGQFSPAQALRDSIFHAPGASTNTPGNQAAVTHFLQWAQAGYFGRTDEYISRSSGDTDAAFAKGQGALTISGSWANATIVAGLGSNVAFFALPPGADGKYAAVSGDSQPWHISAKTKYPDLAAAYLNFVCGQAGDQTMVSVSHEVPALTNPSAKPTDAMGQQIATAFQLMSSDDGMLLFPDWSTPTMMQTRGGADEELVTGKLTVAQYMDVVQKDWAAYDAQLHS